MNGLEALRETARQESARVYTLSVGEATPELWKPPTNAGQVVNQYPPYAAMCGCGHSARLHPEDACAISDCGCAGFEGPSVVGRRLSPESETMGTAGRGISSPGRNTPLVPTPEGGA